MFTMACFICGTRCRWMDTYIRADNKSGLAVPAHKSVNVTSYFLVHWICAQHRLIDCHTIHPGNIDISVSTINPYPTICFVLAYPCAYTQLITRVNCPVLSQISKWPIDMNVLKQCIGEKLSQRNRSLRFMIPLNVHATVSRKSK